MGNHWLTLEVQNCKLQMLTGYGRRTSEINMEKWEISGYRKMFCGVIQGLVLGQILITLVALM